MRNFLRVDESDKQQLPRWRGVKSSLLVSGLLLVATLSVGQLVRAVGQTCDASNGSIFTPPRARNLTTWQKDNFYYKVFVFYANDTGTANSGATCGVSLRVNTNAPQFLVNGVRPVDVRLGVPNMDENNKGIWADGQIIGKFGDLVTQPPQYHNNFHSFAGYADDGGMATIASDNRHKSFQTLWCQNFNPDAPGAGGAGPGSLLPGDNGQGCSDYATPNSRDITSYGNTVNGTGFMFTADNCHFGIDGQPATDSDGFQAAPCKAQNTQTDQNMWYWNPMQALPDVTAVTSPNTPKANLSLKNYIGCNGTGSLCDGRNDVLDPFTVHQYSRNHLYDFPGQTCAQLTAADKEACATSSQTVMTFAYPVPATLSVTKTPSGCSLLENTNLGPASCSRASTYGSYLITLRESTASGFERPLLTGVSIRDSVPVEAVNIHRDAGGVYVPTTCPSRDRSRPSVSGASNQILTWNVSAEEANDLKEGRPVYRCYNVNTKFLLSSLSPQPFTNTVAVSGTVSSTNLPARGASASTLNYIYRPEQPYLATSQGDVHTGGMVGFKLRCDRAKGSLTGQSAGGSTGTYVVSAGQGVATGDFVTNFDGGTGLTANVYQGVCRPDLASLAKPFQKSNPGLVNDNGGSSTFTGLIEASSEGKLVMPPPGNVTLSNLTVRGRVTLFVDGDLIINGANPVTVQSLSGTDDTAVRLGSFGAIVTGNIYISSGVSTLNGYYYAQGNTSTIYTCTNNATLYTRAQTLQWCQGLLTLSGLMSSKNFVFNRVGNINQIGPQKSEDLIFNAMLFIAPPPLFDGTFSTSSGLTGVELAPPQF